LHPGKFFALLFLSGSVIINTNTRGRPRWLMPDPQNSEPSWHLDEPFWRSSRIYGESLSFIRDTPDDAPKSRLLFPPVGEVTLTSATRETVFSTPGDYIVESATGIVTLPPGSRIPFMNRADLYRPVGTDFSMSFKRGDEKTGLYFGEKHLFHDMQAEASYEHSGGWEGYAPVSQMAMLPRTAERLASGGVLTVCLVGDSISAGANASAMIKAAPRMPPYYDLVVERMRALTGADVRLKNYAISGTGMKYGASVAPAVMKEAPDLVIVAYGMNDVGFFDVEEYVKQTRRILDTIGNAAEVLLVSSTLGNAEWQYTPREKFFIFRDALRDLCGPGIALADMTQLWADMLKVKAYHDLTGNGVNHPNDFGHRTMASALLDVFGLGAR
jgi:acyl-CoA thioesterase I